MSVWAGMATLSERSAGRAAAIDSLLPQVDRLAVTPGDGIGDQVKFAACAEAPDVFLGVDDDLVYPPDYVATVLNALARYPEAVVSFHGWRMDAHGRNVANFRCLEDVEADSVVHVVGTGVCAFRVGTLRPKLSDFPAANAADIFMALRAFREGVPLVVLAHEEGWLGYTEPPRTIWRETKLRTGSMLDASSAKDRAVNELARMIHP